MKPDVIYPEELKFFDDKLNMLIEQYHHTKVENTSLKTKQDALVLSLIHI